MNKTTNTLLRNGYVHRNISPDTVLIRLRLGEPEGDDLAVDFLLMGIDKCVTTNRAFNYMCQKVDPLYSSPHVLCQCQGGKLANRINEILKKKQVDDKYFCENIERNPNDIDRYSAALTLLHVALHRTRSGLADAMIRYVFEVCDPKDADCRRCRYGVGMGAEGFGYPKIAKCMQYGFLDTQLFLTFDFIPQIREAIAVSA